MKTIGLLGGMSWESTAVYYRLLNEGVRTRLGELHSASCIVLSVDFANVEYLQTSGQWELAGDYLATCARNLEHAGAEGLIICTNTMHRVYSQIATAVAIPVLHIADAVTAAARTRDMTRPGLLGTRYTMEHQFYRDALAERDLTITIPDEPDRQMVDRIIYDELCRGVISEESRDKLRDVTGRLAAAGCDGVILGCTELGLLLSAEVASLPVLDTTVAHADATLTWMLD
jgi:aspartate racemase